MLLGIARPYRNKWHNVINITLFTSMLMFYFSLTVAMEETYFRGIKDKFYRPNRAIIETVIFIPLSYGCSIFLRAVVPSKGKRAFTTMIMRKKEGADCSGHGRMVSEESTPLINH